MSTPISKTYDYIFEAAMWHLRRPEQLRKLAAAYEDKGYSWHAGELEAKALTLETGWVDQ